MIWRPPSSIFFFFNDTATTEIYTLSLHDALPICSVASTAAAPQMELPAPISTVVRASSPKTRRPSHCARDRKSTRLNSSHGYISYAVFCLKKKQLQLLTLHLLLIEQHTHIPTLHY